MDRLAYLAQEHWQKYLPTAYASIEDKRGFFQTLSDEAQAQIEDLEESLRGPDQADEPFADRMGRYRMARLQAEEIVFRELLLPPAEGNDPQEPQTREDAELEQAMENLAALRAQLTPRQPPTMQ